MNIFPIYLKTFHQFVCISPLFIFYKLHCIWILTFFSDWFLRQRCNYGVLRNVRNWNFRPIINRKSENFPCVCVCAGGVHFDSLRRGNPPPGSPRECIPVSKHAWVSRNGCMLLNFTTTHVSISKWFSYSIYGLFAEAHERIGIQYSLRGVNILSIFE